MASLPSYENMMTTLLYGKDTLKFEQVSRSLLSYNKTRKVASNESQALVTEKKVEANPKSQDLRMTNPKGGQNQEAQTMHAITTTNSMKKIF